MLDTENQDVHAYVSTDNHAHATTSKLRLDTVRKQKVLRPTILIADAAGVASTTPKKVHKKRGPKPKTVLRKLTSKKRSRKPKNEL